MGAKWGVLLDGLKGETVELLRRELPSLLADARADPEEFVRRQADKTELYLNQLAAGEATAKQVEGYLVDVQALTEMHGLKMAVAGKASAQRLVNGIEDLILNGLLKLLAGT